MGKNRPVFLIFSLLVLLAAAACAAPGAGQSDQEIGVVYRAPT